MDISLTDIQRCSLYRRIDIKTTNPRKLFRFLSNVMTELGYSTNFDVKVERDEIGEIGSVNANLAGKLIGVLERKRDITHQFTIFFEILGVILVLLAITSSNYGFLIPGVTFIGLGYLIYFKFKREKIEKLTPVFEIFVKGIGEVYGGKVSKRVDNRGAEREQVYAEISLHIGGEVTFPENSPIPSSKEELEAKKHLNVDIGFLLKKLDEFAKKELES